MIHVHSLSQLILLLYNFDINNLKIISSTCNYKEYLINFKYITTYSIMMIISDYYDNIYYTCILVTMT